MPLSLRFLCCAQAKPVAGIAKCRRSALDQCKYRGVRDAVVRIGHIGAPQADFLEEAVGVRAVLAKVVDDPDRQPRVDPVDLGHCRPPVAE